MENQTTEQEAPVFELETLKAESLPQLQGWREKQEALVAATPFISCKNHKTYTQAKKNRTALVSARTSIEGQEKVIASQLKKFRNRVGEASKELIAITQPHEEKQQEEVKRYEAKKEEERLEKERVEQERIDTIKNRIANFYSTWKGVISTITFDEIESQKKEIVSQLEEQDEFDFQEFQEEFNEKVVFLKEQFQERVKFITEREEARKEKAKLAAEKAEFEAKKKNDEEAQKAREKAEAEKQRKIIADKVSGFIDRLKENGYKEIVKDTYSKEGYSVTADVLKSTNETEFNNRLQEVDSNIKKDAELEALREAQAKADAEKKTREEKEVKEQVAEPEQVESQVEPVDSNETPEPEVQEAEQEPLSIWEMPETTPDEIIDKISEMAQSIRNDWNDPRSECRSIVALCEKLKNLNSNK